MEHAPNKYAPAVYFMDKDGKGKQLRASTADKLRIIAASDKPVGRLQQPKWRVNEIRAIEDRGLATVTWLEIDDTERVGAWQIEDLTTLGYETLAKFDSKYGASR